MNSNQTPSSSSPLAMSLWHEEVLPESWSQLLLGGSMSEVERCGLMSTSNYKKRESWEDQMVVYQYPSEIAHRSNDELNEEGSSERYYFGGEEIQLSAARVSWGHQISNLTASSPRSCVTTSFGSGMLDFSNNKAEKRHLSQPLIDQHECNSTERDAASKKTRVHVSCSAQSPIKVRKEKLGDRITALHQLVSPFGKTDTASVLLEAIGYIRFLQNQIEALSSPYLVSGESNNTKQPGAQGRSCIFPEDPGQLLDDNFTKKRGPPPDQIVSNEPKDLRSRGLCLVPLSCMLHVGSDNGPDYWAASFDPVFR